MNNEPTLPATQKSNPVVRVMKNDSFVEKVILLILTAVLSGIFIPLVVKSIDRAREAREAVAAAQAKLFEEVSETILTYETLMLDVTWFGTKDARNPAMQNKAFEWYSERSVDLVAKWRAQSSRAQALASPEISEKLEAFLQRVFREQDTPINRRWTNCPTNCDWEEQHEKNRRMLLEANSLILELANDVGLTKKPNPDR